MKKSKNQPGNTTPDFFNDPAADANGRWREGNGAATESFSMVVDKVPYLVKASPFSFNGETRFYISINNGDEHVFTWDANVRQLRAIDDNAVGIPDSVEVAISEKLQMFRK